jgi:hypothetical protein
VNGGKRAEAMALRVATAAQRAGIQAEQRDLLFRLLCVTFERRQTRMPDEHHPDFLHPGRNALILIEDLGVREPGILAAAIAFDSMCPRETPSAEEVVLLEQTGGWPLLEALRSLPAAREELVEALVIGSDAVRLVAVCEMLDHARHLHLRERSHWQTSYELVEAVYMPLSTRTHPTLERRFSSWCRVFAEKYLGE